MPPTVKRPGRHWRGVQHPLGGLVVESGRFRSSSRILDNIQDTVRVPTRRRAADTSSTASPPAPKTLTTAQHPISIAGVDDAVGNEAKPFPNVGLSFRAGVEQPLSPEYLWSARLMAHLCREREDRLVAEGPITTPRVDFQVRSFAMAAIFNSVAMMEARVNELWADASLTIADGNLRHRIAGLSDDAIALIATLHQTESLERSLRTLEKFDVTLRCVRKPETDKERYPYQAVEPLTRLRNALIHYKLEIQWGDEVHYLEKRLGHLLPPNPLVTDGARPWFPLHPLCAGVAEWAWKAAKAYVDEWHASLGLNLTNYLDLGVPLPGESS